MKISKYKKLLLVVGVLLALLIVKIVLFLTVKPKVTVDYVAEYNRISLPQNYDPNENAAPYYQKAFDAFIRMSEELRGQIYVNWPTDFNNTEQARLAEWLLSNSQAFEYFREAVNKPDYWLERKSERDNTIAGIMLPESSPFYELTKALVWNAKFYAAKGQIQTAFEYILDCYRAGKHKCRPNLLLIEQLVGLHIKQDATHNALLILDKSRLDSGDLKSFQDTLQAEFDSDAFILGFNAEKLSLYDALQRLYIDNGKGTGKLAWSAGWYITLLAELDKSELQREYESLKRRLYYCLLGPTRNEVANQIEELIGISGQIMTKTPWQNKNAGYDYFYKIEKIENSSFFFEILGYEPKRILNSYSKTVSQSDALIAVLAILRYKNDTAQFPESLEKLVSVGYLKAIPQDPYSNGPLIYKPTETNFKLYSVGPDFKDDGGLTESNNVPISKYPGMPGMGLHAQPPNPDIVYWPVVDKQRK